MRLVLILVFAIFISGCNDSIESSVVVDEKSGNSPTSIYLPGGVGLQFDAPNASDEVVYVDEGLKVKFFKLILNAAPDETEKAVSEILLAEGYKKTTEELGGGKMKVYYKSHDGQFVYFLYSPIVQDGLKRKTGLSIWWKI